MALMPVAEAYAVVLKDAAALPEEMVALTDAHHRTLSRDIAALRTQPPADMSAMDGYAVRAADAAAGARLKVIGEVAAGRPFNETIGAGQAARIFTGGLIPDGADAVVIQEDASQDGNVVIVNEAIAAGKNIRRAGIDYREGEVGLRRGSRLNDRALALAAGMNHPQLPVHRRPRIAILATGDELVAPGTIPALGQIVYSNFFALSALVRSESAEPIDLGIARDTLESTAHGIQRARDLGADVLVTTGGASVGDHDLVQAALKAEGFDMAFWKIALRPGKPMMHGRLGPMRVLPVPGAADPRIVRTNGRGPFVRARGAGTRTACQRQAAGLSAGAAGERPRWPACGDLRGRAGQLAGGQSGRRRCADRPGPLCSGGPRRLTLHDPPASQLKLPAVDVKLRGCGTHMEQIVFVHDLFRVTRNS
jgi:molybdopterin molybdotransferase